VALIIVREGDIQLTTEQRKKMTELKRKQIVNKIAINAINPQTKTPHPPKRIEMAMEEAKVQVDPFKPIDLQVQDVLKALQPIIPIRFEKAVFAVKLLPDDYGRCFGDLKRMGRITKQEWSGDGSWIGLIEIPAGLQTDLFDMLNGKTRGRAETKLID
jgi:ribosome maturation protein SDO1